MSDFESTAAQHDILKFADTPAGRIEAELHYLMGYVLADAIDTQMAPLVMDTGLLQSAELHGTRLARGRIAANTHLEPVDIQVIEQRAKVFVRGAVFAAIVEMPEASDEIRTQLARAYVPPPFAFVPRGESVSARAIEQYELEARHAFRQIPKSDHDAIAAAVIQATEQAPVHQLVPDQDEFMFGYVAVRQAIERKLQSLNRLA